MPYRRTPTKWTTESFVKRIGEISPSLCVLGEYTKYSDSIKCHCSICGNTWFPNTGNLLKGCGCPECAKRNQSSRPKNNKKTRQKWTQSSVIEKVHENDPNIQEVNGDHIVVITVPRADRSYKPVYVDGNPVSGTYRRNGEGDYKCTSEELHAMYRDASVKTQDMLVLNEMGMDVFNSESLRAYRQRMRLSRPGHVWDTLEDEDFLVKMGAAGIGEDGKRHPTAAGLLMFGNEYEIVREYPQYFLDYREEYDDTHRWTDRIISSSGDWSGNVFDFFYRVYNRLQLNVKVPFTMDGLYRVDDTPVHQAIREALANCLVNADYYGRQGLVIINKRKEITMSNPGIFRIEIDAAKSGGVSDPRNGAMLKMFNMIDVGERAGSGIPNIFRVWHDQRWSEPTFTQSFDPDRTALSLPLSKGDDKKVTIKKDDKRAPAKTNMQKRRIIEYLSNQSEGRVSDLADMLGVSTSRVKKLIYDLIAEDAITAEGSNKNRIYKLKL